jgi:CXXX repeat modification system protein
MAKKLIGKVTEEEKDEIKYLFERKNGLTELFKIVNAEKPINEEMYNKIVKDIGEVSINFNNWWSTKQKHYNWEDIPGRKWEIDFDTCEIYLVG